MKVRDSETLEVPEVRQLPEFSANEERPVDFVDMMLTRLFAYDNALLYAEHAANASAVSWCIAPREGAVATHEIEVGVSPSLGSFRSVLARFGHHYMNDQLYHGYSLRCFRQGGRVHRCHIYMSNDGLSGFWIRVYAAAV